eukprot:gene5019-5131_t
MLELDRINAELMVDVSVFVGHACLSFVDIWAQPIPAAEADDDELSGTTLDTPSPASSPEKALPLPFARQSSMRGKAKGKGKGKGKAPPRVYIQREPTVMLMGQGMDDLDAQIAALENLGVGGAASSASSSSSSSSSSTAASSSATAVSAGTSSSSRPATKGRKPPLDPYRGIPRVETVPIKSRKKRGPKPKKNKQQLLAARRQSRKMSMAIEGLLSRFKFGDGSSRGSDASSESIDSNELHLVESALRAKLEKLETSTGSSYNGSSRASSSNQEHYAEEEEEEEEEGG